ncbi:MAG TPA: efflux RND transporter periplasmic adaptor subunit [Anaerolineales bacterium]|nr:efflux RND transporter periplasmic adaptor subunit [Anaerolineales bacterium]
MLNALKNKRIRNLAMIGVVIVAVILLAGQTFLSSKAQTTTNVTGKVVSVMAAKNVESSGSLKAQPFASLTWETGGVVEEVYVKAGDQVKAGDVLMKLNVASVDASVFSAQADLENAKKDLDDLLISSDEDLAQATIDLKDAREAYDQAASYLKYLQTSPKVRQTYTKLYYDDERFGWETVYKTRVFKARAPEDWIIDAENDAALKKAQLEDAQRAYDRLKDGPNAQDVTIAQARIDAAQATVDSMSIIAPFDGQVLYVESQPNDVVTTDSVALNMANPDHLYIETQVSESEIASVKVGEPVTATLEAVPGLKLTGRVAAISALGKEEAGSVEYTVRIDLDPVKDESSLPLGSTASVTIQAEKATKSLAVPITVIQNDSQGEYVLVIRENGSTKRVDVVGGVIVGDLVTVSGNLKEGDALTTLPANNAMPMPGSGRGTGRMMLR